MKNMANKRAVCGVIGNPIGHTLSPLIHHTLAAHMGQALDYVPFLVESAHLEEAIKGARALNVKGLNVTMPHKKEVMEYVEALDEMAKKVGAVNTLVSTETGYKGYNTDAMGLRMALECHHLDYENKNVAIIGSGGAAYASVVSVMDKAKSIHIFNRTKANGQLLKEHFEAQDYNKIEVYSEEALPKVPIDYVIQTTGVGMGKLENQIPKCTGTLLKTAKIAVDLIYNPAETCFLKEAKEKGCLTLNGFDMLFYQAVLAYELMHHCTLERTSLENIKGDIINQLEQMK